MACDGDILVNLVEQKPFVYNFNNKEYSNTNCVQQ